MSEPSVRVSEAKVSRMVDPSFATWNQITCWLRRIVALNTDLPSCTETATMETRRSRTERL